MRTDAERAAAVAQDVAETLAAYDRELSEWECWTPAATRLRAAIGDAMTEARDLAGCSTAAARSRAH